MRGVSPEFNEAVRGSHTMVVRARLVEPLQFGSDPEGVELQVIDGDVTLDSSADIRGTLDITIDGTDMFSFRASGQLTPYGNEIFVQRGVMYASGSREWVSLGYYRIYQVEQDGEPDSPIRISGRDRMSAIIDARMVDIIQFDVGTSVFDIFETLLFEVYPDATPDFDYDASLDTIIRPQVADEDRYQFLLDLARSRGKVMFWDQTGNFVIQTAPDPSDVVSQVNAGENGVLLSMNRQLNRDGVYNAVIATGQAPDGLDPVRAVARDMNPDSPTFWNGKFGKVPRYYFSTFITTVEQASSAAEKILVRSLGLPYNVNFQMVPNPALEPLDPIEIVHEDGYENHVIERITIPLSVQAPMTAQTREQTIIVIETEI